jgi:hypothetical protein
MASHCGPTSEFTGAVSTRKRPTKFSTAWISNEAGEPSRRVRFVAYKAKDGREYKLN